jgi:hypothetical protein
MATQASITSNLTLGLGLLSSLGPKVDVVGIYSNGSGQGGAAAGAGIFGTGVSSSVLNSILGLPNSQASIGQLFTSARPMKATIRETSKVMEHPVETGVVLADHHIINPVEIDLSLLVTSSTPGLLGGLLGPLVGGTLASNYATTYSQIRQAFVNATPLAVKTRVGVYSNMIIADMPHEEDPDMFDVIVIGLHLKQVIYIVPGGTTPTSNYQPLAPANTNTLSSGLQSVGTLGTQLLAGASGVSTYFSTARKGFL